MQHLREHPDQSVRQVHSCSNQISLRAVIKVVPQCLWLDLCLTCGQILVAVVWTDFLNQPVVCAIEGHVDADDLERFGAHPGDMTLSLLLSTRLRWIVVAQNHLLVALGLLIVHPAIECLWVLGVDDTLALQVEFHLFHWWDKADRDVAHTSGVVAEVDSKRAIPMIHDLTHYQQIQFHCLDVGVEVSPTERPGEFWSSLNFHDRPKPDLQGRVGGWLRVPPKYFPKSLFWMRAVGTDG